MDPTRGEAGGDGSAEAPALEVRGLRVRYGDTVALDAIDLVVGQGEVVAVVGPSGCGKSTLLRAVAGLEPVAAGRILAAGRDLGSVPTHQRGLGLMFQEHALFPHQSVADNIGFGLRMAKVPAARQRARVSEMLALVGLEGYEARRVDSLSGGEAQRVALARALAPAPSLLMFDEPLGSLDRVRRDQLTTDLGRLLAETGVSALYVTHDQAEAFALADRVVIVNQGRIEQEGRPETLWRQPASRFVAEFLGHGNLWEIEGATVMVPSTALRVDPEGAVVVIVDDVRFADGQFHVAATGGHGRAFYQTGHRPTRGERVHLAVDWSQAVTLP